MSAPPSNRKTEVELSLKKRHTDSGRLGFLAGRGAHEIALRCCFCNGAGVARRNRWDEKVQLACMVYRFRIAGVIRQEEITL
jgi:hypothetical protein